ncbi:MAG: ABC transporter ATP-binding protein [Candidatus Omnitrophota bacterium]|nr:ABC transporter ATP-binding protein [Candidatus Omnitrophota bacterium]
MAYFKNFKNFFKKLPFYYTKQIIFLVLLKLVSSSFLLVSPFLSKLYMDDAFLARNLGKFLHISVWGAAIFILSTLFLVLEDIVKNKMMIKLKLNFVNRFIRKFYSFELDFFQSKSAGENTYRLADVDAQADFAVEQCPRLLADLFKLVIILVISLWVNLPMTIILLLLSPLFLINSVYIQRKLTPIYRELWECRAKLSKEIHDAFSRILIIKAFGLESYQRHAYLRSLIKNIRLGIKSFRWSIFNSLSSSFLSKAVYGIVTLFGGWLIIKGRLTIGSYTAAMLYLMQLGSLLESLSYRFEYVAKESVSLERFLEIMDSQPGIKDLPGASSLESIKGSIQFNNVTFGYQQKKLIFKELDLDIPPHTWMAIVGSSGCGKSTLINLILRLYEPSQGEVLLDGMDLRMIRLNDLRKNIAIATQQPLLFDVSIRENISGGLKNLTPEEIEEAARIAGLEDYIKELPQGLDTLTGEDACLLSHGLKQRVALARAIARKPCLLILDEAISSVDAFTEEKILAALRQKRRNLSTIVISHRLFVVKDADRIYFLKGKSIIEEGTHAQLLAKSQSYQDFFKNQNQV